jgi:hypothetical protein
MLAKGGLVTKEMLAMVGDGGPEAVIPLNELKKMVAEIVSNASGGGVTIVNQGTIVGSNGMNEFANIISRKIAGSYGLSTGGNW